MTQPRARCLDVYFGKVRVGILYDTEPLAFEYDPRWLSREDAHPIVGIALRPGRHSGAPVQAYFENLLPEGALRQYLAQSRHASTLYSLLYELAGDTAGGYVLVPAGQKPGPARYQQTSWATLARRLSQGRSAAVDVKGVHARISLAGAQDKTSIALFADGVPRLPKGTAPSTHIIKPNIKRLPKIWHSAANETIIMLTAARCGLPTAEVFYEPGLQACVVRRFDRHMQADGQLGRLVQYDLCQLAGIESGGKYEIEGGPSIQSCAQLIRTYSAQPAIDLRHFVGWIFFNLFVGNHDSHAKNLSIYQNANGAVTLTPFYDLMCTRIYPGLSSMFAFSIGGQFKPGAMRRAHIEALARALGMRPQFVLMQVSDMAQKIPNALVAAIGAVQSDLSPSALDLVLRIQQFVISNIRKMVARFS